MEELNKKDIEEKEKSKEENKETSENNNGNSEKENFKLKIGTLGNFVLVAFIIVVIGTGALTYYLIHSAKDDYDKQYNEIISNLTAAENVIEEDKVDKDTTVATIIDSALSDVAGSGDAATTTDESTVNK